MPAELGRRASGAVPPEGITLSREVAEALIEGLVGRVPSFTNDTAFVRWCIDQQRQRTATAYEGVLVDLRQALRMANVRAVTWGAEVERVYQTKQLEIEGLKRVIREGKSFHDGT
jgi:hypothetical protein